MSVRGPVTAWAAALGSVAASAFVLAGAGATVRAVVVFFFLLACPGLALVPLLRLESVWTELTFALAVSFVLDALVAGVMVEARLWSVTGGVLALAVVTLLGSGLQAAQRRSRPDAEEAHP